MPASDPVTVKFDPSRAPNAKAVRNGSPSAVTALIGRSSS
jgi:hypothetical protein